MHTKGTVAAPTPGQEQQRERELPLGRVVAFIAMWLGGSWLLVGAWLATVIPGGWITVAAGLALISVPVTTLIRGVRGSSYPSAATRLLILRPFWYGMLFMPLLAASTLLGGFVGLFFGNGVVSGRWALGICATALAVLAVIGFVGSRRLVLRRLEVRLPRLSSAFDGLRVIQISDVHVGPHTSHSFLRRIGRLAEAEKPDLIAVTGDEVDDFARDVEPFSAAFGELHAPLGVFVVPGNHDVYAGWEAVCRGLREAGFRVLVNDATPIDRDGQRLWIAGTGDPAGKGWSRRGGASTAPDIERTLAKVPLEEPVLALAHNPALWPALAERRVDLTLSGHTHYGQLAIPGLGWSMASPFLELAMGAHRRGRSLLYISPGSNYWGIPFRIGTPPEVTLLTLRVADDQSSSIRPATSTPASG